MPLMTGMMLGSVEENLRGSANSISQFCQNAFGIMPAPVVYGLMSQFMNTEKEKKLLALQGINSSHVPMAVILYSAILTSILMLLTINRKHKLENQKNELIKASSQNQHEAGEFYSAS